MVAISEIIKSIKYGPHLKTVEKGEIKFLKGNHFDEEFDLDKVENSFVSSEHKFCDKFLLNKSDIILAAKGFKNFAWRYTGEQGCCIASSLFYVIKINEDLILSEYFALVINAPKTQHQLKLIGSGVTTPSIPKSELLKIKIPTPTREVQNKLVRLNNTLSKQINIEKKLIEKKKELQGGLLNLLTKNELLINKKVL